jgi:hypothetical protein
MKAIGNKKHNVAHAMRERFFFSAITIAMTAHITEATKVVYSNIDFSPFIWGYYASIQSRV